MSKALELADKLDDTPNWQKEKWGSQWKHSTLVFSRDPFEAAAELRRLAAVEAAAKNLVKVKGRYHTEQAFKALQDALGETK